MELEREGDTTITPTVTVLLLDGDSVLLVKHLEGSGHKKKRYGLPGGVKDYAEDEKDAAAREFAEETGFVTKPEYLIPYPHNMFISNIARNDDWVKMFSMQVFLCRAYKGKLRASDETIPQWVKLSELPNYILLPNVKTAIENGLRFVQHLLEYE